MGLFSYKGYDAQGSKVEGQIEASDLEQARQVLHQQELMVISVGADSGTGELFSFRARRTVNAEELGYLTSELTLLLNAGVTIDRGLAVIRRSAPVGPLATMVATLHDAVRRGECLSDAMITNGDVFNPLYINLVKLGESSGTLPQVFGRLAEDIQFQSELKSKIVQAVTYPAVIFFVCVLCIVFVFNYIVPQMSGLFEGLPEIPVYTSLLLGLSAWMINYQWFLLLGIGVFIASLTVFIKTPTGKRQMDDWLLRIPGIRQTFVLVERIRFNTAISMTLTSGISIDRCLEMSIGSVSNHAIRHGLLVATERVKKGETLSKVLGSSILFPDFSISLIEVGEESGRLEPVFNELSARARRDFESWVDRFTALLEPLLILFMGGVVGGVVTVMLLSIVSVNDVGF